MGLNALNPWGTEKKVDVLSGMPKEANIGGFYKQVTYSCYFYKNSIISQVIENTSFSYSITARGWNYMDWKSCSSS